MFYVPLDFGLGGVFLSPGVTFWRRKEESSLKRIFLVISTKMAYPTDEALKMIIYLATLDAAKKWTMPLKNWKECISQFLIYFENLIPEGLAG